MRHEHGIDFINPFYDKDIENPTLVDEGKMDVYEYMKQLDPVTIVERDIECIYESMGVIAFVTDSISYGTIMEIVYAYNNSVPVYMMVTNGYEEHPWLKYHATEIFTLFSDLEEFLVVINR